ncbi:hypothetical protein ACX0G7_25960 [Flavitalea antarctica]
MISAPIIDTTPLRIIRLFDNHKPFRVIVQGSEIQRNTTDKDTAKCARWTLTTKQVEQVIKFSEEISGTVWDLAFSNLSCSVQGKLIQDKIEYLFNINAGSYVQVTSGDTTIVYGDFVKSHKRYFLSSPEQ